MQILNSFSGVREAFNPYAVLELSPVLASGAEPGEVRIRGLETGLYVALDAQVCLITKSFSLLLHLGKLNFMKLKFNGFRDPKAEISAYCKKQEHHYAVHSIGQFWRKITERIELMIIPVDPHLGKALC